MSDLFTYLPRKMPSTRLRNKVRFRFAGIMLLSFLLSAPLSSQEPREAYLSGLARMKESKYREALEYFDMAVEADRDNARYYVKSAECHYQLKEYREAIGQLMNIPGKRDGAAEFLAAKSYAMLGDADHCIEALRAHLLSDNRLPESTILLDEAFAGLEDNRQWIGFWKQEWYQETDYQLAEINYLITSGDYLDAMEILNDIINSGQADHRHYALRARAYTGLGNLNNALSDYNRALEKNNSEAGYYLGRAALYIQLNKPARSLPDYTKAIQLQPDRFDSYYARAQAYLDVADYESASSDMQFLLRYFPDNTAYLYETGMIYYTDSKYSKALEIFNRLLRINTGSAPYFMARANTYMKINYYRYAQQDYSMALDLDPSNAECYLNKGLSRFHLGDKEGACVDWKKAERLGAQEAGELLSKHCK